MVLHDDVALSSRPSQAAAQLAQALPDREGTEVLQLCIDHETSSKTTQMILHAPAVSSSSSESMADKASVCQRHSYDNTDAQGSTQTAQPALRA